MNPFWLKLVLILAIQQRSIAQTCTYNKRLIGYTFKNLTNIGIDDCTGMCMFVAQCLSLNYQKTSRDCELNSVKEGDVSPGDFTSDNEWKFTDIIVWGKALGGACRDKPCTHRQQCVPTLFSHVCVDIACSTPFPMANADLTVGGLLVNDTITYTCKQAYSTEQGNTTIVKTCQFNKSWTSVEEKCVPVENICRTRPSFSDTGLVNVALNKNVSLSSLHPEKSPETAAYLVDGTDLKVVTDVETYPYMVVDLVQTYEVYSVFIKRGGNFGLSELRILFGEKLSSLPERIYKKKFDGTDCTFEFSELNRPRARYVKLLKYNRQPKTFLVEEFEVYTIT